MTTITKVKMGFVALGIVLFAVGMRLDDARWRYAGITCIAIAWVMRFVRPAPGMRNNSPNEN